ncbi:MAG: CsgG/HfaB family protein [Myxococcota bacterium]
MGFWIWMWSTVHAATLAILPFDNHTGNADHDALGTGVSVMLMSDLGAVESLQLVERSRLKDVIDELKFGQSEFADPKTAAKAGKVVGADWILTGALVAVEPELRIDARIIEVKSGNILGTGTAKGPIDAFFDVEKDLALTVTDKLGLALSAREAAKVGRVATESFDAFRAWSQGLDAIDRGAVDEARQRFTAALRYDSGFSAANSALDGIKASRARAEGAREEAFGAEIARLEAMAESFRKGRGDVAALRAMIQRIQTPLATAPPPTQRRIAGALIDLKLDESVRVYEQSPMTINEFATYFMFNAAMRLRDRDGLLSWGQTYLDRYPNGLYYLAVRSQLDLLVQAIEKAEKARQAGAIEKIEAKKLVEMYDERCENRIVPKARARDCRAFLVALENVPEPQTWWFRDVIKGAQDAGDVALADDALAAMRRYVTSPADIRSAEESVADFKEYLAKLDSSEAEFRAALAKGSRSLTRYFNPHLRSGAYERALTLVDKIPDAEDRQELTWKLLVRLGRIDALNNIHQAVMQEAEPFMSEGRRKSDLRELRSDEQDAAQAEVEMLCDVASELQREGLQREAAERYDVVVAKHLNDGYTTPASLLLRAASAWNSTYGPGAPEQARVYYERVVREYPDSIEANSAKIMLPHLP